MRNSETPKKYTHLFERLIHINLVGEESKRNNTIGKAINCRRGIITGASPIHHKEKAISCLVVLV